MRIGIDTLFESPRFPTGATGYMINLLRCLAQMDTENEYFIFVSDANRHLYNDIHQPNFHFVTCWASNEDLKKRILAQQFQVPRMVKRYRIDVFNSPGNTAPLSLPCRSILTIKTLHHYRFPDSLGFARAAYRRAMIYLSAHRADYIIANSISNRDDIVRFLRVRAEKVGIIHEAVDTALFQEPIAPGVMAAKLEALKIRPPFILNVSSMWRYKNQTRLIRAFAALKRERAIPHQLVLVGGSDQPDYYAEVLRTIEECGVADDVRLAGYRTHAEIRYLYRAAEVFVYPSSYETFGLTLVEAMASGVPIISSDRGSLPEIIGNAGIVIDPDRIEELTAAMASLLESSSLRESLVARGLRRVNDFSWQITARKTRDVYLEIGSARHMQEAAAQ
jgi:glycosyltransferase involved in cell wall biosynthesis